MYEYVTILGLQDKPIGDYVSLRTVVRSLKERSFGAEGKKMTIITLDDLTGIHEHTEFVPVSDVTLVVGELYYIEARVNTYNGSNTLKPAKFSQIEDNPDIRREIDRNFSKFVTDEQEQYLSSIINGAYADERYRRLSEIALGLGEVPDGVSEENYRKRYVDFKTAWASEKYHDSFSGGLFNHICGELRIIDSLEAQYSRPIARTESKSTLNWDRLRTLTVYHDLGKIDEYIHDSKACVWNPEKVVKHMYDGIIILTLRHNELPEHMKLSFSEFETLKRAILCHHGTYGDVEIKTDEERIFNAIDILEANNVNFLVL